MLSAQTEYQQNLSPYLQLWAAVMDQAYNDYWLRGKLKREGRLGKQQAKKWINSDREGFNTFIGVCETLKIDPVKTKREIKEKMYRRPFAKEDK